MSYMANLVICYITLNIPSVLCVLCYTAKVVYNIKCILHIPTFQVLNSVVWHSSATRSRDSQGGIKTLDDEYSA